MKKQHDTLSKLFLQPGQMKAADKKKALKAMKLVEEELQQKNRELEIEAALEKVRAVATRMKQSSDMIEICKVISKQLQNLKLKNIRNVQTAIIYKSKGTYLNYEFYTKHNKVLITEVNYTNHRLQTLFANRMLKGAEKLFSKTLKGSEVKNWLAYQKTTNQFADRYLEKAQYLCYYWFSLGAVALGMSTYIPLKKEEIDLFKRFRNVFDLAYKRYNDIEKAEAQAREAQIEASLERVRAKAMAMHNSADLTEAAGTVFTELNKLGINPIRTGFVLLTHQSRNAKLYPATSFDKEHTLSFTGEFEFTGHPVFEKQYDSWKKKENYFPVLEGDILKSYYKILSKALSVSYTNFPTDRKQFGSFLPFTEGFLFTWSDEQYSEKEINILERFKVILNLTITRFLDLQKAEAQARESQIEVSLERVRSKTMAMHNSQDVADTVATMFDEWVKLGIKTFRCGIGIMESDHRMEVWTARPGNDGKVALAMGHINMSIHPLLQGAYNGWKNKQETFTYELKDDDIKKYFTAINNHVDYPVKYDLDNMPSKIYHRDFYFPEGTLFVFSLEELSAETSRVLQRFSGVLSQTYRRFLDLQRAEAQTREAKIEASLERVRSKTMAMHSSEDILSTTTVIFAEMKKLGIESIRCGVALLSKDSRSAKVYASATFSDGELKTLYRAIEMTDHPSQVQQYQSWLNQENYFTELKGDELRSYYQLPFFYSSPSYTPPDIYEHSEFGYYIPFSEGLFYAWAKKAYSETEVNILIRFKTIIDLTFRRYLDLQKAEEPRSKN